MDQDARERALTAGRFIGELRAADSLRWLTRLLLHYAQYAHDPEHPHDECEPCQTFLMAAPLLQNAIDSYDAANPR